MSVPATTAPANTEPAVDATSTGQPGATPAQENRADPTQVSNAETSEQTTRGPDFFRQAFQRIRPYAQQAQVAESAAQPASNPAPQAPAAPRTPAQESERSAAPPSAPNTATTLPPAAQQAPRTPSDRTPDGRLIVTQAELDRRAQAEADRIIAKREADQRAKAERDREVELRRTNPFEYAQLMEDRERDLERARAENKSLSEVAVRQLLEYDRNVLDIFVSAVPESDRAKVIAKTEGIAGRKETAAATLKHLRSTWMAEGRASARSELMKDPLFIKEMLARFGAAPSEPTAPVQVRPSASSGPEDNNQAVNAWMRGAANSARQQTGR